MSRTKTKRTRHNRFVRVLAELYELDYQTTYRIYQRFDKCVGATKMWLSKFYRTKAELDFIDTINLCY